MTIWARVFISEAAAALAAGLVIILCSRGCVPDVWAQSFTVDVDYQLQRQYKGPLLKHEVFTNGLDMAAYIAGGAASRAYAGQIVVLVEGGVAEAYALEPDGSGGLVGRELGRDSFDWSQFPATGPVDMDGHDVSGAGDVVTASGVSLTNTAAVAAAARPAYKQVPYKDLDWRPWDWRTDEWSLGFEGIGATNNVWIDGGLYSLGGYRTVGTVTVGDHYLEGMSVSSHGRLSQNRLSLAWAPEPWRYGQAYLTVAGYDLLTFKVDGDANTMTELQNPRLIIHGGLQADTNNVATNRYGGELVILGTRVQSAGAAGAGADGAAFGRKSMAGVGGLAAGTRAYGADGAFVFADSQDKDFSRKAVTNGFSVRAQGGAYVETPSLEVTGDVVAGGNVQMGTAYGTNVIAGDTQIGNSERLLEINQKGLTISDAVSETVEFAVEQYAASKWRVDLRGNPITNAGVVSATGFLWNGTDVGALVLAALPSNTWAAAPSTTNYMPRTEQILTNAVLQSGLNARVLTNDVRYLASLTNAAAFATAAQGTRADMALTNLNFGVDGTAAYRGDWGQAASNLAYATSVGKVDKTDARYLASLTNAAAFATAEQGAKADMALTNQLIFGVDGTTVYRGDWGQAASNLAYATSIGKVDKSDPTYSRTSHGHGLLTADGRLGGSAGLLVQTTTAGLLSTKPAGTTQQWLRGDGQWATAPTVGWQNPAAVSYWTYSLVPWGSEPTGNTDWANRVVVMLQAYTGPPDVVIPDFIDGYPVAILQSGWGSYETVFTEPGSILTITAGRNLDYIGAFALSGLTNLYRLDTPGLTRLGEGAISGCTALETLHFPNTLTYLEGQSLYDLPNLQAVYWGGDLPLGGNNPFGGSTTQVVNYVTNPTATGWGAILGTRPVVRMEATVGALTLGGVRRVEWPGHYWPSQTATYKAYKFPAGDYLFGDGNNLFYVTAAGVTNPITSNP